MGEYVCLLHQSCERGTTLIQHNEKSKHLTIWTRDVSTKHVKTRVQCLSVLVKKNHSTVCIVWLGLFYLEILSLGRFIHTRARPHDLM